MATTTAVRPVRPPRPPTRAGRRGPVAGYGAVDHPNSAEIDGLTEAIRPGYQALVVLGASP